MNETNRENTSGAGKFPFPGTKKATAPVAPVTVANDAPVSATLDDQQGPSEPVPVRVSFPASERPTKAPRPTHDPSQNSIDQVQLGPNGEPFTSAESASAYIIKGNFPGGTDVWGVIEYESGFGITTWKNIVALRTQREREAAEAIRINGMKEMTFSRVRLAPKFSDNDPETHVVSMNGQDFTLRRGMESVIPDSHVEVIRNASMEDIQPIDKPGFGQSAEGIAIRVGNGRISRIPIVSIIPATKQEFEEFRLKQRELRDVDLAKHQLTA